MPWSGLRTSEEMSLTLRSTGEPTACHQAPGGGTRYIFTARGLASCRWLPVTSNVRPPNSHSLARPAVLPSRAPNTKRRSPSACTNAGASSRSCKAGFTARSLCPGRSCWSRRSCAQPRSASTNQFLVPAASGEVAFGRCCTMFVASSALSRVASGQFKTQGAAVARSTSSAVAVQGFAFAFQRRPNPSVNRRANGMPPGPPYALGHHALGGPGVQPLPPGYLKR
jgi:hypothetical protein